MNKTTLALISLSLLGVSCHKSIPSASPISDVGQAAGVVYGEDSRTNSVEITNPVSQKAANATAVFMLSDRVLTSDESPFIVAVGQTIGIEGKMCLDERFTDQVGIGGCSGVLVAPDLLLTAGHCIPSREVCTELVITFDYTSKNETTDLSQMLSVPDVLGVLIPKQSVYGCSGVVMQSSAEGQPDFALISLDRPVEGVEPITIGNATKLKVGDKLSLVGHPSGISKKISTGLVRALPEQSFLKASLDSFKGDSGGPVFTGDGEELVGILIGGEEDYVVDTTMGCRRVKKCEDAGCDGETVFAIPPSVRHLVDVWNQSAIAP